MSLEHKISAREISQEAGMSARPEFYSGRGAISCDLNSKQLETIYGLIKNHYGEKASEGFVKMVSEIPVLSATDFLISLYFLEGNNWEYNKYRVKSDAVGGISVDKNKDGSYNMEGGMFGLMAALSSNGRNETEYIRRDFLVKHGITPKRVLGDNYLSGPNYERE